MARKLVVTSGKGGVGKTTICCGLGYALAGIGYKTLLVDMDFGLNNLDILMGIENKIVYDIIDVLEGKCMPKDALVQDFFVPHLYTFPSTHGFCRVKFGARELLDIIRDIENDFEYIIIDCPAGIDGGFKRAVACADEYIIVTTPHISAIRDADKVIGVIKNNNWSNSLSGAKDISIIVNRVRGDMVVGGEILSPETICKYLGNRLIGIIPEDDCIATQLINGVAIRELAPSRVSIDMIARNIVSGESELYDYAKKYRGALGGIRKKLRKWV